MSLMVHDLSSSIIFHNIIHEDISWPQTVIQYISPETRLGQAYESFGKHIPGIHQIYDNSAETQQSNWDHIKLPAFVII
jgi:hypothetical protein